MLRRIWAYYRHPHRAPVFPVAVGVGWYIYLLFTRYHPLGALFTHPEGGLRGKVEWLANVITYRPMWIFLFWVGVWVAMVAGWLFFFAQFTLPVSRLGERWKIFTRLRYYIFGKHGPAIFIQDGQKIENERERLRKGPGVVVLDTASAAVMEKEGRFTQAAGPGVAFPGMGETVPKGAALDLRKRAKVAGPLSGEDPFAPQQDDEDAEAYQARQERRWETSAKTRDGTEVVARIVVVFALDKHPDDLSPEEYQAGVFHTRFYGHKVSAWRAVAHRPVDAHKVLAASTPLAQDERLLEWHWLPPRLAADVWREYLQYFRLTDLFQPVEGEKTALDILAQAIRERLTKPYYQEMVIGGRTREKKHRSREYDLLQKRGIRVIAVSIPELFFPPAVEAQLVERWGANWMLRAKKEQEVVEHRRALARQQGERQAAEAWGELIEEVCCQYPDAPGTACLDALLKRLAHTAQSDPALYAAQQRDLEALKTWWAWAHRRAMAQVGGQGENDD